MAGWFGLFVTALNLVPLGQLDGGHVVYAAFGLRHRRVVPFLLVALFALGFAYAGWWFWMVMILVLGGLRHPPTLDDEVRLDGKRKGVVLLSAAILVFCFNPKPIWVDEGSPRRTPHEGRGTLVHQLDLHRGAEDAGRHRQAVRPQPVHEAREERLGDLGAGCPLEAGPAPAREVGPQRELRHRQHRAAGL